MPLEGGPYMDDDYDGSGLREAADRLNRVAADRAAGFGPGGAPLGPSDDLAMTLIAAASDLLDAAVGGLASDPRDRWDRRLQLIDRYAALAEASRGLPGRPPRRGSHADDCRNC